MRIGPFIEIESGGGVVKLQSRDWSVGTSKNEEITCNSLSLVYRCTSSIHKLLQAGRREGLTGCSNQDSTILYDHYHIYVSFSCITSHLVVWSVVLFHYTNRNHLFTHLFSRLTLFLLCSNSV